MSDAEILISFQPKGDAEVLSAIKKVTWHVGELKKIAKAPIDLNVVKNSMRPEDFNRLKAVIDNAKEATRDLGKEAAKAARDAEKLAASMAKVKGPMQNNSMLTAANFSPAAVNGVQANLKNLNGELDKTKKAANGAGQGLGFVGRIMAAMAIRSAVREVFSLADSFTQLQNKIKTVTDGDSLGYISDQLFQIAQSSRTSLDSVVTAYTRTTRSVKALGKSQAEVLQFTETLSKAIQVGGSSAVEASNAMIQLSQGMGSGRLSGDELRSVLEQLPVVAQLIADEMGVATSALRGLGSAGKLTTEVVFDAINNATEEMNEKMKNMQLTVGQAWAMLRNQATMSSQAMQGTMNKLANAIMFVTNNFDSFVIAGRSLAQVLGVTLAVKGIGALISGMTALKAVMATHPLTFWAVLAATVAAALQPLISQLRIASDSTATFGDVWSATWDVITDRMSGDVKGGVEGIDKAVEGLSETATKTLTIIATLIDKFIALTGIGFFIQKGISLWTRGNTDGSNYFKNMVEDIALVTNQNASLKETNKLIKENQDLMAADMAQDGPGVSEEDRLMKGWDKERDALLEYNKILEEKEKKEKGNKPKGSTFAEVMSDINKDISKTMLIDDSSDPGMTSRIASASFDVMEKMGDYARSLTDEQAKLLKKTLEEKLVREDMLKLREETQKQMLEQDKIWANDLVEGIKMMVKAEETMKEYKEARADRRAERETKKQDDFNSIADTLDPNMKVNREIQAMTEFQRMAKENGLPEWAELSRKKIEELEASMRWDSSAFKTFADQMNSIFGPGGTLVKGFSDSAAKAIVMSSSLKELKRSMMDLLNNIQQQALSALIQLPLDLAIGSMTSSMMPSSSGATSPTTSAVSSDGLFRAAPFADGGYTGNYGINEPAGIVHGQEYVLNADATRRIGKENLDMLNKGGSGSSSPAASSSGSTGSQVTVHNYAGVQVETNTLTPGQVEIMITKHMRENTGKLVAGQINDPNSPVARSLSKNVDASRRRV